MIAANGPERDRRFDRTSGFAGALLNPGFPAFPVQEILEALFHRETSKPPGPSVDFIPKLFLQRISRVFDQYLLDVGHALGPVLGNPGRKAPVGEYTLS